MQHVNLNSPIWQLTVSQFIQLIKENLPVPAIIKPEKRYVYGIDGLAVLFGCSKWKANEIKQSGKIDAAIMQNGRKIIVDADLAIKLFGKII